jgi:hypothetical protein
VLRFVLEADDLLRSRFALSPLIELDNLLRRLSGLSPHRLPAAWSARLTPVYHRLRATTDLDVVLALLSRAYGPDFTAPPPRSLAQSIEDDLATVRATTLPDARREIARCLDRRPVNDERILAILRSEEVVERTARALETAWQELLAADWPQLRAVCERDVVHRAGQLSRSGWAAALEGLHSGCAGATGPSKFCASQNTGPSSSAAKACCWCPRRSSGRRWPRMSTRPGQRR